VVAIAEILGQAEDQRFLKGVVDLLKLPPKLVLLLLLESALFYNLGVFLLFLLRIALGLTSGEVRWLFLAVPPTTSTLGQFATFQVIAHL
jgi:hypothetical protein